MTENPEFDLDSSWLDPVDPAAVASEAAPAEAEGVVAPEPVVVIQYRSRGLHPVLMLPIALVATLALLMGYHKFVEPAMTRANPMPPPTTPESVNGADEAAAAAALAGTTTRLPMPLTLDGRPAPIEPPSAPANPPESVVAAPAPAPAPEAKPEPEPEPPSRISIATASPAFADPAAEAKAEPAPAVEPVPVPVPVPVPAAKADVAAAAAPPAEAPLPTQEEMMERLRQEAELKAIQRAELERRNAEDAERFKAEAVQRVEDERDEFRHQLREILKRDSAEAGKAIRELCDQFGRLADPAARERATAILSHNKGRLGGEAEVRILRSLGMPEPIVLDFLCNRLNRSLNSRGGPRNADEARVIAARQLLRIPPNEAPVAVEPASAAPPSPSPARSPVYRRSSR